MNNTHPDRGPVDDRQAAARDARLQELEKRVLNLQVLRLARLLGIATLATGSIADVENVSTNDKLFQPEGCQ